MSENNNKNIVSSTNSYSQALFELANENNSIKEIEEQVIAILKLISDKFKFNKLLNKFLNFIIIKRRIYFIEEILKIF